LRNAPAGWLTVTGAAREHTRHASIDLNAAQSRIGRAVTRGELRRHRCPNGRALIDPESFQGWSYRCVRDDLDIEDTPDAGNRRDAPIVAQRRALLTDSPGATDNTPTDLMTITEAAARHATDAQIDLEQA